MRSKYNLIWISPIAEPSGYGVASRGYIRELVKYQDINIKVVGKFFWGGDKLDLGDEHLFFEELSDNECIKGLKTLAIFHLTPDHYQFLKNVTKHVCMTTFETDSLPDYWIMPMRSMDEVWTYTNFNKYTFSQAGIDKNKIYIIPHGVNIEKFQIYKDKKLSIISETIPKEMYIFASVFDWHSRKNPELLVEAFLRAFQGKDDVCLLLKTFYSHVEDGVSFIQEQVEKIRNKIGLQYNSLPKIYLLSDILTDEQMIEFYNSIDCFVLPSRGEGWGLVYSDAMAAGKPVIATGWGGNVDFMTKQNSFLLPSKLVYVKEREAQFHPYFKNQKWAEVRLDDLISCLKYIYNHREEAIMIGLKAQQDISKFTWSYATNILYNNIIRVLEKD